MLDQRQIAVDIDGFIENLIGKAVSLSASDIHLQPEDGYGKIRLRIDGALVDIMQIKRGYFDMLSSKIKLSCGMDISQKRMPQDRAMQYEAFPGIDFRVSSVPTILGEKIVIRILSVDIFMKNARLMGFSNDSKDKLERAIGKKSGIILMTGPTGSGKTTSLYALLEKLNKEEVNIITIEDPVEYKIENINQISINEKIGLTYPVILKSILRQDPDIIMIGEIRDRQTAEIAIRAAITGHLILSTAHTRNAFAGLIRLKDLGVEDYLIRSAVNLLAGQRLVRKLCDCKKADRMTDYEYEIMSSYIKVDRERKIFRPNGCPYCNGGYRGRQAVEEVMSLDNEFKDILRNFGMESKEIKEKLKRDKFRPMIVNGLIQVLEGDTSFEEVLSVLDY
ncbi:GspE/PulE family protein [uncultured Anaerococcus sp.]|uniref:GspE/PulE family protein n=1 Tax=uncultured Anaerococcus sp. TaxID=293428 RepID=UPI00288C2E4B|nr:GspE/PulE family protein [uncultured Anaerococcus sp.]